MRAYLVFLILSAMKALVSLFYRVEVEWIGDPPRDRWKHHRIVALLNHTSLYEPIFIIATPAVWMWRLARHGVVPIASKTADRAVVGRFFGLIAQNVISITRERDESWNEVLRQIDPDAMVALLPEGRMKRANGLDSQGKSMSVRGGIADILSSVGEGRMLLAYSGGLHHIQVPGQRFPRLFKRIRMNLEVLDIAAYREAMMARYPGEREGFKRAVVEDLEQRRDRNCPPPET